MKHALLLLVLAVLIGSGAYFASYAIARCTYCATPDHNDPSAWMHQEFHLDDAQYAKVKQLEEAYYPHCANMCDQIDQSHMALKKLIMANATMTPEIAAALKQDGDVQQQCRMDMLKHFYDVSNAMPPAEGKRYLQIMQTQVVEPEKTSNATVVRH